MLQLSLCLAALQVVVGSSPMLYERRTFVHKPLTGSKPLTEQTSSQKVFFGNDVAAGLGVGVVAGLRAGVGVDFAALVNCFDGSLTAVVFAERSGVLGLGVGVGTMRGRVLPAFKFCLAAGCCLAVV